MNKLRIVLVRPEIPQNTGNIARTCAVTGAELHLIGPLGFSIADRYLRRAGLDYWSEVNVHSHESWDSFLEAEPGGAVQFFSSAWFLSARARLSFYDVEIGRPATIVFGSETKGLGKDILQQAGPRVLGLPQRSGMRSLNLSNAAAVCVYETLRQWKFPFE